MKYAIAAILMLAASSALADERVLTAGMPAWCHNQISTGACVPGAKDYRLVNGRVIWRDAKDTNNKDFWAENDRWIGGSTMDSGGDAGSAGTGK